jgi:hypothetical protein
MLQYAAVKDFAAFQVAELHVTAAALHGIGSNFFLLLKPQIKTSNPGHGRAKCD